MKKEKFSETKVGRFLKEKAPGILELVGDVLPDKGVLGIVKNLVDRSPDIPEADRLEFSKLLMEHELQEYQASVSDLAKARDLQMAALAQEGWLAKNFIYLLASFVILSATAFGLLMFWVEFPESNRRLIEMYTDIYLFSGAIMVLTFFFGSSIG